MLLLMRVARHHRYKAPSHHCLPGCLRQQLFLPTNNNNWSALRWFFFNENQMLLGTAKSCPCVGVQLSVNAHSTAALGRRKCATALVRAGVARAGAGRAAGKSHGVSSRKKQQSVML